MGVMSSLFRSLIRTSAFIRKEIYEILRQTRLVFTLILGPFLILLLFGVGYRDTPRTLETLFVIAEDSGLRQWVEEYAEAITPQIRLAGITADPDEADRLLRQQRVDLVVVAPPDPYQIVRSNEQAVFYLYHYEIDPYEETYVEVLGRAYTDEINRQVLVEVAEEGKVEAAGLQENLVAMRDSARNLRQALETGDATAARLHQETLNEDLDLLTLALGSSFAVLSSVQQTAGIENEDGPGEILASMERIGETLDTLGTIDLSGTDFSEEAEVAAAVEEELDRLDTLLSEFRDIDSYILVSPFRSEILSITEAVIEPTHFFVPAVIALLLQHIAVTVAALSIVSEHRLGTMELFRAAPVTAFETLLGKYGSYLLLSSVLAAILTALIVLLLQVPMLGDWGNYSLVIALLLFISLGVGFNFSLSARTDSQAVQYAMMMLLASIFFSGLFLSLYRLWLPVRFVSWLLPATYGTVMLQDVMLRGQRADLFLGLVLLVMGTVLLLMAWVRLRLAMTRE